MAEQAKQSATDTIVDKEIKPEPKEQTLETATKVEKESKDVVPLSKFMSERNENKTLKAAWMFNK